MRLEGDVVHTPCAPAVPVGANHSAPGGTLNLERALMGMQVVVHADVGVDRRESARIVQAGNNYAGMVGAR